MGSRYIDICYHSGQFWGAKIASRAKKSLSATIQQAMASWESNPLRELCLAVSTKHAMVKHIAHRIDNLHAQLSKEMSNLAKLDQCLREGTCFPLSRVGLAFEILIDVDSFVFESRSAYEIMGKFLRGFFKEILAEELKEERLLEALKQANVDTGWVTELREIRKVLFHETAAWIAIRVISTSPVYFELVICKKDTKDFSDPDDFIRFEELRKIYSGFEDSLPILECWVGKQIAAREAVSSHARNTSDL